MQSDEYKEDYFIKTRSIAGLLFKTIRPMWWRWIWIIRRYKQSGRLLDIGCGEGYFLQYAERYYDTYGMDVSEYGIKEAECRTLRTRLSVGSVINIDYENEFFDVITCFDVLEHIENPEIAIQECGRVLKNGGIFIIRVPNTASSGHRRKKEDWFGYRDKTHVSLLDREMWLGLLRINRFQVLDVLYDGLWDTPYLKRIPKILQDIFIKFPSLALFFLGLRFKGECGENLCVVAKKVESV